MRLLRLDIETRKWVLQEFPVWDSPPPVIPFYAVLSHTWGSSYDEVRFEDVQYGQRAYGDTSKRGYDKLRFCYEKAAKDGLMYFWIDTCCIKKSDSSELQQSLASMFYWYQRATRCYVYLSDVSIRQRTSDSGSEWEKAFYQSRWFKRGWTLQELIAPASVCFYSKENEFIGEKNALASTISAVTRIPTTALRGLELSYFSKEERLSWTEGRTTTVPEDAAYCLMGIFDVELHMLYADGDYNKRRSAAEAKLHRAIQEKTIDAEGPQDVMRIGGASWSDLTRLSENELRHLDSDLEQYQEWLLVKLPKHLTKSLNGMEDIKNISHIVSDRMRALLAKHNVRYEELSHLDAALRFWEEPWSCFDDNKPLTKLRLLSMHTQCMASGKKDSFITAAKTLKDLMIWRKSWKEKSRKQ